jgi:hypothetical protein
MTQPMKTPIQFPQVAKKHRPMATVDTDMLIVEYNTPIPKERRVFGKYDKIFESLKFGSCVACELSEMNSVCNGLRKYLQRMERPGRVISVKNCQDGKARVWLTKPGE